MRRRAALAATVGLITATFVISGAGPAAARHSLTLRHVPPPTAAAGVDLVLPLAVEGCGMFCGDITVKAVWVDRNGKTRSVSKRLNNLPHVQATTLTIAGAQVTGPTFSYHLTARQQQCPLFTGLCHTAETRAPSAGVYSITVRG